MKILVTFLWSHSKWEPGLEPSYNSRMVAVSIVPSHKHLERCSLEPES